MKQNALVEQFVVSFVIQFVLKGKKRRKDKTLTKPLRNCFEDKLETNDLKENDIFRQKKAHRKNKPENDRKVVDKIIREKWVARCGFVAGRQSGSRRLIAFVGWKTCKIKFLSHSFKKIFCRIEKMVKIGAKPHYNALKGKVIIKKKENSEELKNWKMEKEFL